jgi:hypothetical protein
MSREKDSMTERHLKKISPSEHGKRLEELVTSHYEALNYKVTHNVNIRGHQVDHLATKYVPGIGLTSLLLEAKYRGRSTVGIADVVSFKTRAKDLRNENIITAAIMVTNASYSQDAKANVAGVQGISLMTLKELEQDLFNYSESLLRVISDYEGSNIYREYIPLKGMQEKTKHGDIVAYLREWTTGRQKFICVLGDFGVGKTTALERLFYEQARDRLVNADAHYPVLLKLRKLLNFPDVWAFVLDSLRENQYVTPPRLVVENLLKSGKLLLILDGFDEIQTSANVADRASYFSMLAPLIGAGSPCIISTRPTYFQSINELAAHIDKALTRKVKFARLPKDQEQFGRFLDRLGAASVTSNVKAQFAKNLTIDQLTKESMLIYLQKFEDELRKKTGASPVEILNFLTGIYDIQSLMERPLLLNMIVFTILEGKLSLDDPQARWGPAILYELYTQLCAQRDLKFRSEGLTAEERLAACRYMAVAMHEKGSIELDRSEVAEAVAKVKAKAFKRMDADVKADLLERYVTDVQVCSFLSFSPNGMLRFGHRSYYEFFMAQWLVVSCDADYTFFSRLLTQSLTAEVLYFLASYARDNDEFGKAVRIGLQGHRRPSVAAQILFRRIAFGTGVWLSGMNFRNVAVQDVQVARGPIDGAQLEGVKLERIRFDRIEAQDWVVRDCAFNACDILKSSFKGCTLEVDLDQCELRDVEFEGGKLGVSGKGWVLIDTTIKAAQVTLDGTGHCANLRLSGCQALVIGADLLLRGESRARIAADEIISQRAERWYDVGASIGLEGVHLKGVWIDPRSLSLHAFPNKDAKPNVTLRRCYGFVLTKGLKSSMSAEQYMRLTHILADLVIADVDDVEAAFAHRKYPSAPPKEDRSREKWEAAARAEAELLRALATVMGTHGVAPEIVAYFEELERKAGEPIESQQARLTGRSGGSVRAKH